MYAIFNYLKFERFRDYSNDASTHTRGKECKRVAVYVFDGGKRWRREEGKGNTKHLHQEANTKKNEWKSNVRLIHKLDLQIENQKRFWLKIFHFFFFWVFGHQRKGFAFWFRLLILPPLLSRTFVHGSLTVFFLLYVQISYETKVINW